MYRFALPLLVLGLAACTGGDDGSSEPGPGEETPPNMMEGGEGEGVPPAADGPTWNADVAPLIEAHCGGCHGEGGIAPFVLTDYASFKAASGPAIDAIAAGRMPPWQADPECRSYRHERIVPEDAKALIAEWAVAGFPEGEAATVVEQPQTADLPDPSAVAAYPDAYEPDDTRPDDYRCFPLDTEFPEDTYLAGTRVVPDVRAIVHHVLVYVVPEADVPSLLRQDERDEGPGYTCFGGPGAGTSPGPISAWVPGAVPQFTDEGSMQFIPKGSRLVMQVHYNVLTQAPVPDQTKVELFYLDEAQPMVVRATPQPKFDLEIPAGEARSEHIAEFTYRGDDPMVVVGVAPHMHTLGTEIKVEVLRQNGDVECLVDLPDWDFNWQQNYQFKDGEEVVMNAGDKFRLTCVYDNSPENQAVVNGEQLPPRDVTWGEGTLDEMCLNFITTVEPFEVPTAQCDGLDSCRESCSDPDGFGCLMDCGAGADQACGRCVVQGLVGGGGCARNECLAPLADAQDCFVECIVEGLTSGSLAGCMTDRCPAKYAAMESCIDPLLASGACDEAIDSCIE